MPKELDFDWAVSHDPLVVPLFLNLERARKVAHTKARAVWDRHGLTPAEFDVLATLRNADDHYELTPGQIQDRVLLTSGGLTKIIHLLTQKKYVERSVAKEDNRIKPVRLTQAGSQYIAKVMRDLAQITGLWMRATLKDKEIVQVTQTLRKIAENDHV